MFIVVNKQGSVKTGDLFASSNTGVSTTAATIATETKEEKPEPVADAESKPAVPSTKPKPLLSPKPEPPAAKPEPVAAPVAVSGELARQSQLSFVF